ncbi:MAG: signal recognition particle-docking protein FtsY [Candidatus Aenigmatarchaeota archaeon]
MFGLLKKKLKEVINRVSGKIETEDYKEMAVTREEVPKSIEPPVPFEIEEKPVEEKIVSKSTRIEESVKEDVIEKELVKEKEIVESVVKEELVKISETEKEDLIDDLVETDQKIDQEIDKKVEELEKFEEKVEKEIDEGKKMLEEAEKEHDTKLIHEIEDVIEAEKGIIKEVEKEKKELEEIEKKIDEEKKAILTIEPKKKSIFEKIFPKKAKIEKSITKPVIKISEVEEPEHVKEPEVVIEPEILKEPEVVEVVIETKKVEPVVREEPAVVMEKAIAPVEKEKKGFFTKIGEKVLSENDIKDIIHDIHHALLENDVALEVADCITNDLRKELIGKTISRGKTEEVIEKAMHSAVLGVLNQEKIDLDNMLKEAKEPILMIFLGFNGAGKTTTLARIAHRYEKYKPVIAAGDTFRAASIEQLEEHSKNLKVDLVKHRYGADSAAVIFDAKKHAVAIGSKLVLADTAGRAHTNANLMDELKKICRVNKPDIKVLVLDALTGNDIYDQAKLFDQAVGVDAIILTKTDVYEKGGSALSAAYTIKKPILFIGTGQGYDDLKEFNPEEIVKNLLG